jgi:hypothetical protein
MPGFSLETQRMALMWTLQLGGGCDAALRLKKPMRKVVLFIVSMDVF